MTEIQNLILDQLRYMRSAIDELCEDMREVKMRLDNLIDGFANLSSCFDGLDARLGRIEQRLDVIERHC